MAAGCPGRPAAERARHPDAVVWENFTERAQAYVRLHERLVSELPAARPTQDSAVIALRERTLAAKLRDALPADTPGPLFTEESRALFRRLIVAVVHAPGGRNVRALLMDDNPAGQPLRVHDSYPDRLPLSTVPPPILAVLPPLPAEIEYRFVGRTLIVRDVEANFVVDAAPRAVP
jgi:hypothetical protein